MTVGIIDILTMYYERNPYIPLIHITSALFKPYSEFYVNSFRIHCF